jgi:flavin reductase (DIM6/NTAB) family NADH-FMN oxidoreductase RutF
MKPPMVLVSRACTSGTLEVLTYTKTFGLNILESEQACTATNFADKGRPEKFVADRGISRTV